MRLRSSSQVLQQLISLTFFMEITTFLHLELLILDVS